MRNLRLTTLLIATAWLFGVAPKSVFAQEIRAVSQSQPPAPGKWRMASPMRERREYGGGVRLHDGRILAVSGHPLEGRPVGSAELYDPKTGVWSDTGSLAVPRNFGNSATLLDDGSVLIAGGHSGTRVVRGAEIYDPAAGRWAGAGDLAVARDPVTTLLADGRVFVTGGIDWTIENGKAYDVAEIFDPKTGEWSAAASMLAPRYAHRTVRLDDGRVLVVGGYRQGDVLLASTELYDPKAATWQAMGQLPSSRVAFGLVKLPDGRVLMVGGFTGRAWRERRNVASAAIYDAKTAQWRDTRPMKEARAGFSITLLPDGRVLAAGGWANSGFELASAELFDPATEVWQPVASMNVARRNHRAALLPGGSVLVIGGSTAFGGKYLSSCEIFSF
jgi:N-acetylneuraminic acid mutarotase